MLIFLEIEYPKMNAEIEEDLKSDDSDTLAEKLYANELKSIIFMKERFLKVWPLVTFYYL